MSFIWHNSRLGLSWNLLKVANVLAGDNPVWWDKTLKIAIIQGFEICITFKLKKLKAHKTKGLQYAGFFEWIDKRQVCM